MARTPRVAASDAAGSESVDPADLGAGTYYVPGVGLVRNGELLDGNDPDAVTAFHDAQYPSDEAPDAAVAESVSDEGSAPLSHASLDTSTSESAGSVAADSAEA